MNQQQFLQVVETSLQDVLVIVADAMKFKTLGSNTVLGVVTRIDEILASNPQLIGSIDISLKNNISKAPQEINQRHTRHP